MENHMPLSRNPSHPTEQEFIELVRMFADIEDSAVRHKLLDLVRGLSTDSAELVTLEELGMFQ